MKIHPIALISLCTGAAAFVPRSGRAGVPRTMVKASRDDWIAPIAAAFAGMALTSQVAFGLPPASIEDPSVEQVVLASREQMLQELPSSMLAAPIETMDFSLPSYSEATKGLVAPDFDADFPLLGGLKSAPKEDKAKDGADKEAKAKAAEEKKAQAAEEKKAKAEAAKAEKEAAAAKKEAEKAEKEAKKKAEEEEKAKQKAEKEARRKEQLEKMKAASEKSAKTGLPSPTPVAPPPAPVLDDLPLAPAPELPKVDFKAPELPKFEAPKFDTSAFKAPELPKFEAPKFNAPKFDVPKFEAPKFDTSSLKAPELPKVDAGSFKAPEMPKVDVPAINLPKFEAPKLPSFGGGGGSSAPVSSDEEFIEPQEVRDERAKEAATNFREADSDAKVIEAQAREARGVANAKKKIAKELKDEACETRWGGKFLCFRPLNSGY